VLVREPNHGATGIVEAPGVVGDNEVALRSPAPTQLLCGLFGFLREFLVLDYPMLTGATFGTNKF